MDEFAILPAALLVAFCAAIGFGAVKACQEWVDPAPCQNYSYKISRLPGNPHVASCTKWDGMTMRIEKMGFMSGQMVHCTCPGL